MAYEGIQTDILGARIMYESHMVCSISLYVPMLLLSYRYISLKLMPIVLFVNDAPSGCVNDLRPSLSRPFCCYGAYSL